MKLSQVKAESSSFLKRYQDIEDFKQLSQKSQQKMTKVINDENVEYTKKNIIKMEELKESEKNDQANIIYSDSIKVDFRREEGEGYYQQKEGGKCLFVQYDTQATITYHQGKQNGTCIQTCNPQLLNSTNLNVRFGDAFYENHPEDANERYLTSCCYKYFIYNNKKQSFEWNKEKINSEDQKLHIEIDKAGGEMAFDDEGNTYIYSKFGDAYCFCSDGNKFYFEAGTKAIGFHSEMASAEFYADGNGNVGFNHYSGTQFYFDHQLGGFYFTDSTEHVYFYYPEFSWGNKERSFYFDQLKESRFLGLQVGHSSNYQEEFFNKIYKSPLPSTHASLSSSSSASSFSIY